MPKRRIKAVIEAYSSQPSRYQVGWVMPISSTREDPIIFSIHKKNTIISDQKKDVYVGRDENAHELFLILADSVNVEYFNKT